MMRAVDFRQALHVCRLAANAMLVSAADTNTGLTSRDRQDLAAIAAAIHSLLNPTTTTMEQPR